MKSMCRFAAGGLAMAAMTAPGLVSVAPANATVAGTDGRIVAQATSGAFDASDIVVMNDDGTGATPLTTNPGYDGDPVWSPDGTTIAYDSSRAKVAHIWTMNADGTRAREVSHGPGDDYSPAWSPDGRWLAYFSDQRGREALYLVRADGTHQHRVTPLNQDVSQPDWSPDGRWIAFASDLHGSWQVYKIRPDGSHQTQITHHAGGAFYLRWSPDGKQIVFDDYRPSDQVPPLACMPICGLDDSQQIWVVRPDGRGLRQLTSLSGYSWTPAWSPDSTQIVYSYCVPGGDCDLWVMNRDGSGAHDITRTPTTYEFWPDWQSIRSSR